MFSSAAWRVRRRKPPTDRVQLARLVAIQEISDLIGRYCMAFDDEDWAQLDTMWTDDAAFVVEDQAFETRIVLMDFLSHCLPPGYKTKHMISRPIVAMTRAMTTLAGASTCTGRASIRATKPDIEVLAGARMATMVGFSA